MKRFALAIVLALGLFAAAPAVNADIDIPTCFPCN
jgi:hypothetical protein